MTLFSCERGISMKLLKRTLWLIPVLAATLITAACSNLLSVEPLADAGNTVFDPALLGVWVTVDDRGNGSICSVRQGDDHRYDIVWDDLESDAKYRLDGQLVKINGQRILDVTPHGGPGSPFYVPGHAFLYLTALPNGLKIQFLDSKWLQEQVKQSRSLAHTDSDERPVITGTTAEMQDFFAQFGLDEQARSEPITLRKLK
jgi:hypothetical protein